MRPSGSLKIVICNSVYLSRYILAVMTFSTAIMITRLKWWKSNRIIAKSKFRGVFKLCKAFTRDLMRSAAPMRFGYSPISISCNEYLVYMNE